MRTIRIVDRDGDVLQIVGEGPKGRIEVVAEMVRNGDTVVLRGLHADGSGPGSLGFSEIRAFAREFGRLQDAKIVEIHGARRTTGANRGKIPKPIRVRV